MVNAANNFKNMTPSIKAYCDSLTKGFSKIPAQRKEILEKITQYIAKKNTLNKPIRYGRTLQVNTIGFLT